MGLIGLEQEKKLVDPKQTVQTRFYCYLKAKFGLWNSFDSRSKANFLEHWEIIKILGENWQKNNYCLFGVN